MLGSSFISILDYMNYAGSDRSRSKAVVPQDTEAVQSSGRFRHDWYFDSCPGISYFREANTTHTVQLTALGFNAHGAFYECGILVAILDPTYWTRFSSEMQCIWESSRVVLLSTRDTEAVQRLLVEQPWTNEGRFHFSQGLLRLQEIDRNRVSLPDIEPQLVE